MDDADLAGPLLFIVCFGTFLLFVSFEMCLRRMICLMLLIPSLVNLSLATFTVLGSSGQRRSTRYSTSCRKVELMRTVSSLCWDTAYCLWLA
jgi:hypothetical protein